MGDDWVRHPVPLPRTPGTVALTDRGQFEGDLDLTGTLVRRWTGDNLRELREWAGVQGLQEMGGQLWAATADPKQRLVPVEIGEWLAPDLAHPGRWHPPLPAWLDFRPGYIGALSVPKRRRIIELQHRDGPGCWICGRGLVPLTRRPYSYLTIEEGTAPAHWPTIDHVIPTSRGGPDTLENLALACLKCNADKADKMPEEACYASIMTDEMARTAVLSEDTRHRYLLTREWDPHRPSLLWIMLNPSIADAQVDDNTIRRVIGFTADWGYGSARVVNLYGLRATKPDKLWTAEDPHGPGNEATLLAELKAADDAVCAWGAWPYAQPVRRRIDFPDIEALAEAQGCNLVCLGVTSTGAPRHPLYVAADTDPMAWPGYTGERQAVKS